LKPRSGVPGVIDAVSAGYTGGTSTISYRRYAAPFHRPRRGSGKPSIRNALAGDLLNLLADPIRLNSIARGPDAGDQYRSAVFTLLRAEVPPLLHDRDRATTRPIVADSSGTEVLGR
jgi:peptide methionine sulfoxide reductase MsrA